MVHHLTAMGRRLSYGSWDHTVFPAIWHKWMRMYAGTWFTYPGGMEGWVDLVDLIAPRPGVEPATFRSRVRCRTAALPREPASSAISWSIVHWYQCVLMLWSMFAGVTCDWLLVANGGVCWRWLQADSTRSTAALRQTEGQWEEQKALWVAWCSWVQSSNFFVTNFNGPLIIIIIIITIIILKFVKRRTQSYRGADGRVNQAA